MQHDHPAAAPRTAPRITAPARRRKRAKLPATLAALGALAFAAAPAAAQFTTGPAGSANPTPIDNHQPSLGLSYFMPLSGIFPTRSGVGYLGQIRMTAASYIPGGESGLALAPEGQILSVDQNQALFSLLGTAYGGNGRTNFALPDLRGHASVHYGQGPGLSNWNIGQTRGSATTTLNTTNLPSHNHNFAHPDSPTTNTGSGQSFSNFQPTLATSFWIATQGVFPDPDSGAGASGPFLGQVTQFAGNFASAGFALAEGQLLDINQNQSLYSILGTTYGGNGRTTFALPDLRGRVAVHPGQANGTGNTWTLGERAGVESNTLGVNNLPAHNHTLPDLGDGTTSTDNTGGGQAFSNTQPGLGINYIIATQGIFPSDDTLPPEFEAVLGEVTMFAGNFAPDGYALLDGQLLDISQNTALFALLGTTYGGDGRTTFALPDMRGRTPVHADGSLVQRGERLGLSDITLTQANLPEHTHDYIPEPTSAALLALAGMTLLRRRRQ